MILPHFTINGAHKELAQRLSNGNIELLAYHIGMLRRIFHPILLFLVIAAFTMPASHVYAEDTRPQQFGRLASAEDLSLISVYLRFPSVEEVGRVDLAWGCSDTNAIAWPGDPGILSYTNYDVQNMLLHADVIYNGPLEYVLHNGITMEDGSILFSFNYRNLTAKEYNEMQIVVEALRVAGFAAWVRNPDQIERYIYAVPIGPQVTGAAFDALYGERGYFAGYDGVDAPDPHGGAILCSWMISESYNPATGQRLDPLPRFTTLAANAAKYLADTPEKANEVARRIDYLSNSNDEDASNMCGPLAAQILMDSGIYPWGLSSAQNIHSFWLANPRVSDLPQALFTNREFEFYHFDESVKTFNFDEWPLMPGDLVYLYAASNNGYDHIFAVTEGDEHGRVYTVSNTPVAENGEYGRAYIKRNADGTAAYTIERLMLYDPMDDNVGVLRDDWVNHPFVGQTGLGGFDVIRKKGAGLAPGHLIQHTVAPGDSLHKLSVQYSTLPGSIKTRNQGTESTKPGDTILIPVNVVM